MKPWMIATLGLVAFAISGSGDEGSVAGTWAVICVVPIFGFVRLPNGTRQHSPVSTANRSPREAHHAASQRCRRNCGQDTRNTPRRRTVSSQDISIAARPCAADARTRRARDPAVRVRHIDCRAVWIGQGKAVMGCGAPPGSQATAVSRRRRRGRPQGSGPPRQTTNCWAGGSSWQSPQLRRWAGPESAGLFRLRLLLLVSS